MGLIDDYIIAGREKEFVPLHNISLPDNYRKHYSPLELLSLSHSLLDIGQTQPCFVQTKDSESSYVDMVAGFRRYYATKLLLDNGRVKEDDAGLWCVVTNSLPDDLCSKIQISENDFKSRIPAYQFAKEVWEAYKVELGYRAEAKGLDLGSIFDAPSYGKIPSSITTLLPIREFSDYVGMDPRRVAGYLQYTNLHKQIREVVEKKNTSISLSTVLPLARFENKVDQLSHLAKIENPSEASVRKHVSEYFKQQAVRYESSFLLLEDDSHNGKKSLPEKLRVITQGLLDVERQMRLVALASENIQDIKHNTGSYKNLTIKSVHTSFLSYLRSLHDSFLEESPVYSIRYTASSRANSLDSVLKKLDISSNDVMAHRDVLSLGRHEIVPSDIIEFHPQNPRGDYTTFDSAEIKDLANSIDSLGLIQAILIMEKEGKYYSLEGNRRTLAVKSLNSDVRSIVVPTLPEITQMKIMVDSDISEQVNEHDRLLGIAWLYALEKKNNPDLSIAQFQRDNPKWSSKKVSTAIRISTAGQDSLKLHQDGLITTPVLAQIAKVEDYDVQRQLAINAAILDLPVPKVKKIVEDIIEPTAMLFPEASTPQIHASRLIDNVVEHVSGLYKRMEALSEKDLDILVKNRRSCLALQNVVKTADAYNF